MEVRGDPHYGDTGSNKKNIQERLEPMAGFLAVCFLVRDIPVIGDKCQTEQKVRGNPPNMSQAAIKYHFQAE